MKTRNTKTTEVRFLKKGDIISASNAIVMEDPYTDTTSPKGTCYISIKYPNGQVKLQTWKRATTLKIYVQEETESGEITFEKPIQPQPMRHMSEHFTPFICKQFMSMGRSFVEEVAELSDAEILKVSGVGPKFLWNLRELMRTTENSARIGTRKNQVIRALRSIEATILKSNDVKTVTLAMIELEKLDELIKS